MEEFDYKNFLVENKLTINSRLLKEEVKTYTADEISRGKASDAQSNDIGDYQFGVKVVPAKSYRDEEEVKNNVMTVKKIDDNPQNPRSIITTLLSDEKVWINNIISQVPVFMGTYEQALEKGLQEALKLIKIK